MELRKHLGFIIRIKRRLLKPVFDATNAIYDSLQWFSLKRRIDSTDISTGTLNSRSRDLWVKTEIATIPNKAKILDAGSGEQKYRKFCKQLTYISQDNVAYDGIGDGYGGHVTNWSYGPTDYVCDITQIPVESQHFDAVLCTEVLEHLPDPVKAIKELTRVLRPGGRLLLTAPFCSFTHFSPYFYSTGFSQNWYIYHLNKLGYTHIELTPNGNFFEYLAQEIRRLPIMCQRYTSTSDKWLERLAIFILLIFLEKCSSSDTKSNEYACYGWHVKAIKNNRSNIEK